MLVYQFNVTPIEIQQSFILQNNTKVEVLNLEENGLEGEGGTYIGNMLKENHFISNVVGAHLYNYSHEFVLM